MWGQIGEIIFICLLGVALAEEKVGDSVFKTAYCACRCCAKESNLCIRHPSIPSSYKCSENMCTKKLCEMWEKSQCRNHCYCDKCKSVVKKDDMRCAAFKGVPKNCKCNKEINCEKEKKQPEEFKKKLEQSEKDAKSECGIPCYCKKCKNLLPPENVKICIDTSSPPSHCDCEKTKCPGPEVFENLKKLHEIREKKEEGAKEGKTFDFFDDLDFVLSPEVSKQKKCRMQCYCSVCSDRYNSIAETCKKMLPKRRVEDCPECDTERVNCKEEDVDQQCRRYCFCKACKADPRMPFYMIQGCMRLAKENEYGCLCTEKEDCSVVEKLEERGEEAHKKRVQKQREKRGKLKKKKKQPKDEL